MSWIYKGVVFRDEMIPENAVGFIYMMTAIINGVGYSYIGKKNFYSNRKQKLGKKSQPKDKRLKKYKQVVKTDYHNYYSSNDLLKEAHKSGVVIKREILHICYSKIQLSYWEVKLQFLHSVLEQDHFLNGNILGKFYKNKIK